MINLIKSRTSYRGKYKDIPVPISDLKLIMEAGLSAPSGCNKQTTSLIAVNDKIVLDKVKSVIRPPIAISAPAFIIVLTEKIYAHGTKSYYIQDYSAAIENMLLAVKALGYESCWYEGTITMKNQNSKKLAEVLNISKNYKVVCVLPVGIADDYISYPQKKPFEERAWFNDFGKGL